MKKLTIVVFLLIFMTMTVRAGEKLYNPSVRLIKNIEKVPIPFEGRLTSPLPSPDERYLAVTRENFLGLSIFDFETGAFRELSNLKGAGFGYAWSDNGLLGFRATFGGGVGKHTICVAHTDGVIEVVTPLRDGLSLPLWSADNLYFVVWDREPRLLSAGPDDRVSFDEIVFCRPSGKLARFDYTFHAIESDDSFSDKVFFLPRLSRQGDSFLVHCLDGHIYLGTVGKETLIDVGEGSAARFARNDEIIVFERTTDDGHDIVSSDLFLYEIASKSTIRLTDTRDIIERMPSMTEDGRTVFFEVNGTIMRGVVQ